MNSRVQKLLGRLEEYKDSPPGVGLELRLSLTELIQTCLKNKGWTQRSLADKAGVKEAYISRILHADANCTLDSVGNLLFALGIRARIREDFTHVATGHSSEITPGTIRVVDEDNTHGETYKIKEEGTPQEGSFQQVAATGC